VKRLRPLARRWLLIVNLWWAVYAGLPWLAPVLMHAGARSVGRTIYALYSTQCHQMAQRSYFLFGRQVTYGLAELQASWPEATDPNSLGAIIGNQQLGWKVAWSDRMVAMYTATLVFGLLFGLVRSLTRRHLRRIPVWLFLLLLLPMALDGGTHLISDLWGIGGGFRATNEWLATLTGNRLAASFYAGDALGSFNSWMRLLSGVLLGLAVVGLAYPEVEAVAADHFDTEEQTEAIEVSNLSRSIS
jgi:uncharacterized membrane protein